MIISKNKSISGLIVVALAFYLICGCTDDEHESHHKMRDLSVRTVEHYGITLDKNATPKEVAFVALRAIKEDFEAKDHAAREAALDIQFDVCAAGLLSPPPKAKMTKSDYLYNVVNRWTPTLSHYVGDFETQWDMAETRLIARPPTHRPDEIEECEILFEVDDLHTDRDPNARVVIAVWLLKDDGYWRVTHVGFNAPRTAAPFDRQRRQIPKNLIKADQADRADHANTPSGSGE